MTKQDQDVLCDYQQGEERGVYLLIQLKTFAPDEETAQKVARQIEDEKKHDRLFATRLKELDVDCNSMLESLEDLYDLAQNCVDRKDWAKSIAIQAVIEELAMAAFTEQLFRQDSKTQEILKEIIDDEARHLQFGLEELGKIQNAGNAEKVQELHRRVGEIIAKALKDKNRPEKERKALKTTAKKAYGLHKKRLKQVGIKVPGILEFV